MTQEIERHKALVVAQEAEIARLQNGFYDLRQSINALIEHRKEMFDEYSNGKVFALHQVLNILDDITGVKE